jgi:hypothetical protein
MFENGECPAKREPRVRTGSVPFVPVEFEKPQPSNLSLSDAGRSGNRPESPTQRCASKGSAVADGRDPLSNTIECPLSGHS